MAAPAQSGTGNSPRASVGALEASRPATPVCVRRQGQIQAARPFYPTSRHLAPRQCRVSRVNRTGFPGDSIPWKRMEHGREQRNPEEVPA